jgi:hypothetical protein
MTIDLAAEMAAARQRRSEQTARALREARVVAVRVAARPDAAYEDLEALARSFYPRLSDAQREEIIEEVRSGWQLGGRRAAEPVKVEAPVEIVSGGEDTEI